MNDTPTEQIRKEESAKWSGAVSGAIAGLLTALITNWKEIMIVITLVAGACNYLKEQYDKKWIGKDLQNHTENTHAEDLKIEALDLKVFGTTNVSITTNTTNYEN